MKTSVKKTRRQRPRAARSWVTSALLFSLGAWSCDDQVPSEATLEEVRKLTQRFQSSLQAELVKAMGEAGPSRAISVCSQKAPQIAAHLSKEPPANWTVSRTAMRVRNPNNAPNDWQKRGLSAIERRLSQGEKPETIEWHSTENGTLRYMRPIMTGAVCLTCHGQKDALPADVKALLEKLYPEDTATGFSAGDLRGAFVVTGEVQ